MRRRMIWVTAVLAVLLLAPAVPASAAQSTLLVPDDDDVTEPTELRLELERDFSAERFQEVTATLHREGEGVGEPVRLECVEGCNEGDQVVVHALPDEARFDPLTGAPFIDETVTNGAYGLRIDVDRGRFQSPLTFEHELTLRVPATAPTDVAAEVEDDEEVEVSWTGSPEPDVDSYRLEHHDGDDWVTLATTSSTVAADEPGEGEHRYRVVALRPDGDGGELESPSDEIAVEITDEDDESDDGNGNGNDDGNGNDNGDGDGGNGGNGGDEDGDSEAAPPETDGEPADESSSDRGRSDADPAPAPETGDDDASGTVPGVGEGNGDDDGYSEELDYDEFADDEPVEVATPSGWRGVADRLVDAEQVAVPIAVGLVMTASGLHLWRWLRVA